MPANVLLTVDPLIDFTFPDGSLPVPDAVEVLTHGREYLLAHEDDYKLIVACRCWHPRPGDVPGFSHFAIPPALPDYKETWPEHCVVGSNGARFHPALNAFDYTWQPKPEPGQIEFDKVFFKGMERSDYSAFDGLQNAMPSVYNDGELIFDTTLDGYLKAHEITHIDVWGIELRNCVFASAVRAHELGYVTTVLLPLVASLGEETGDAAISEMEALGITVARELV